MGLCFTDIFIDFKSTVFQWMVNFPPSDVKEMQISLKHVTPHYFLVIYTISRLLCWFTRQLCYQHGGCRVPSVGQTLLQPR